METGEGFKDEDFQSQEEKEAQRKLQALNSMAHEGALFLDWSRGFCTKKLFAWLDEQIMDQKNLWVSAASREEAEAIRLRTQSFTMTKNWVLAKIKLGEMASAGAKELHDEGVTLEGYINPPPAK